jgi:hypothetical protein
VLRLSSLGDVRPAREALVADGIAAEPLDGFPAVVTAPIDSTTAARIDSLVAALHVAAASCIPLWEDISVSPKALPELIASSVISTPA